MRYIIKTPTANIYKDNGGYELADVVFHGFTVEAEYMGVDNIYAVTEYGYHGFISRGCLSNPYIPNSPSPYIPNAIVRRPAADVVSAPNIRAITLATLYCGAKVFTDGSADSGGYVSAALADGTGGYMRKGSLQTIGGASATREGIINAAQMFLGAQYRWGGKTIDGVDCSGLAWLAYYINGITIWRDACIKEGFPISPKPISEVLPADLIYFPGHVGIYLGDGRVIHSSFKNNGAAINALDEMPVVTGVGGCFAPPPQN